MTARPHCRPMRQHAGPIRASSNNRHLAVKPEAVRALVTRMPILNNGIVGAELAEPDDFRGDA